jgi:hypothetical protein
MPDDEVTSKKRSREGSEEPAREGHATKRTHLEDRDSSQPVEACPLPLLERARNALDAIAGKLKLEEASATITTETCNLEAVCWNWALYGGANATEADPRVYLADEYQKKKNENPTVRRGDSNLKKIKAVLGWRNYTQDEESPLQLVVYVIKGDPGNFPHWELRWTDDEGYITLTKGIGENLKAFNGDSVVDRTSTSTLNISLASLTPHHVLALEDLAKNDVVRPSSSSSS